MVQLVGILNVTPDSFSDGALYARPEAALARAEELFSDGASLVDVGAESTRPGAQALAPSEEWRRLAEILPILMKRYPNKLSLDTHHPETAEQALALGPIIINDVTGMTNPAMVRVVTELWTSCIISHLSTTDVQAAHQGELIDDIQIIVDDLLAKKDLLLAEGLVPDQIILDPGIGFGKTPELNKRLLSFAKYVPGEQVMIGYSRKRFLGENRLELEPNIAAAMIAIEAGATYLRVHDVAGHKRLLGLQG